MHLLTIMETVVLIGPNEWDEVLDQHSRLFPGRDVDSLRRKFTTLHREKIPTGDPNMPLEVRLVKKVKCAISDKAELGDGIGDFDLMPNEDNLQPLAAEAERPIPVDRMAPSLVLPEVAGINPVPENPPAWATNSGLSLRRHKSKEKQDVYVLMALQMKNDSEQRVHDSREAAAYFPNCQYSMCIFLHKHCMIRCCKCLWSQVRVCIHNY